MGYFIVVKKLVAKVYAFCAPAVCTYRVFACSEIIWYSCQLMLNQLIVLATAFYVMH